MKEVYEWKESGSTNLIIETQWFDIIKEHLEMGLTVTNSLLGPLFRLEEEAILTMMMMNFLEHSVVLGPHYFEH